MLGAMMKQTVESGESAIKPLSGGARLFWSAPRDEMLIARCNHRPEPGELAVFVREMKRAGLEIVSERAGEYEESALNSWLGTAYKLRLAQAAPEPAPTEEPAQMTLGIE